MKWQELSERIQELLKLVHAHPDRWLAENRNGIMALVRKHGRTKYLFEALQKCVADGGRLDKFVVDYGMWHVRAENTKPFPGQETESEYYARQGLAGSHARSMHEQLEQWRRDAEAESEEGEKALSELKRRFPMRAV